MMTIVDLLETKKDEIIVDANAALSRSELKHYKGSGTEQNRERLNVLYNLALQSIQDKTLLPMLGYVQQLAVERFELGFDLYEVQTAINILEEVIWRKIFEELPPPEFAEALGLVSTVFGAGKDMLATTYVSLAGKTRTSSLDLRMLFSGTDGI